ncbi:MAG: hypothetical protein AB7H97_00300 [Pseudobdellovibrionaceae bacterium]
MTKKIVSFATLFCLGACTHLTPQSREIAGDKYKIPVNLSKVVKQNKMECGPASIFNSFSLGNGLLQEKIEKLSGQTRLEKFETLVAKIAHKPSEHFKKTRPRTTAKGTMLGDMRFIAQDILETSHDFVGEYMIRPDLVFPFGEHAEKVRKQIENSIKAKVPPVMGVGFYDEGFQRLGGHYVTLIAVSEMQEHGQFTVTYLDPMDLEVHSAIVFESEESFEADSFEIYEPEEGTPLTGRVVINGKQINAPFLIVYTEDKTLSSDEGLTDYITFEVLMGKFSGSVY